jgi:formamidopyrimidine-DNA glycosylase
MPELPEVETLRRSLVPIVVGRTITALRTGGFAAVMGDEGVAAVARRVVGQRIDRIGRRGKYLRLVLDDGSSLVVHLRMTGRLTVVLRDAAPLRFEHLALELDDGHDIRFSDQRKFGRVVHMQARHWSTLARRLGPEPLVTSFTATRLQTALESRSGRLKSVLLDQRLVAGLGNIYVDEALFLARLHPERPAHSLSQAEVRRLHRAMRVVLRRGIANHGTTFSSFQDATGAEGRNQQQLRVYGRGGFYPCDRCGMQLVRIVVGGRGTSFCRRCQSNTAGPPTSSGGPAGQPPSSTKQP